ncbi:MAG: hypothetical protein AB1546_01060 [bacterium]
MTTGKKIIFYFILILFTAVFIEGGIRILLKVKRAFFPTITAPDFILDDWEMVDPNDSAI